MISIDKLAAVFIDMMDNFVDDFDLMDSLHVLTDRAAEISGADSAGLMLADPQGNLQYLASSNEVGRLLELLQLRLGEGPSLDCFRTGEPIVNTDLAAETQAWPRFAARALEAGFQCVHSFPMRLRQDVIGALNLFGHPQTIFTPEEIGVVQALSDVATIAILQERNLARVELLSEQLQSALDSRVVIEQAKGALAQQQGITPDDAFRRLRARARESGRRLTDVAREALPHMGY